MNSRSKPVRDFLLNAVYEKEPNVARVAASHFGVSHQAINRHLRELVHENMLTASGKTRAKQYHLVRSETTSHFTLSLKLEEDQIWRTVAAPLFTGIAKNVRDICYYGFTEMVNNAIDHSEGTLLTITIERTALDVTIKVIDDGVGIFHKIQHALKLDDERYAILELAKGKLTTDPQHHSGQGVFFTSRIFDTFSLFSGNLFFCHFESDDDWLFDDRTVTMTGTMVEMQIRTDSTRTSETIFQQYASEDDFSFSKTRIPVFLAQYGEDNLVSRSQARRVLTRVDRFKEVIFDFDNVDMIGQAFADEIFRVFPKSHPDVHFYWVMANDHVERVIRGVFSTDI